MSAIEAHGLTKLYDSRPVVAELDLNIDKGKCFGLLGPNGAGKTTTLRLLLGLTEASSGSISTLGFPIPKQAREARQKIGVVPQFDNLDPDFTVVENLMVYGRYFGLSNAEFSARAPLLLGFAELSHKANAKINTLSGGMKRRLTLARALINDPALLFLDEPTTGLDPQARHMMWQRLRNLLSQGKTILLTTHFMEEAERLCDRLIIMDNGKTIACGTPRELIDRHVEAEVIELYGEGMEEWAQKNGKILCSRTEKAGESLFCYTENSKDLLSGLQNTSLKYMHRPANLEDVFLKLTGRELRD